MEIKKIVENLIDTFLKAGELSISLREKGLKSLSGKCSLLRGDC